MIQRHLRPTARIREGRWLSQVPWATSAIDISDGLSGDLRHLCAEVRAQYFADRPTTLIGTGGFARLFEDEGIFDAHVPERVLIGLREALRLNS